MGARDKRKIIFSDRPCSGRSAAAVSEDKAKQSDVLTTADRRVIF